MNLARDSFRHQRMAVAKEPDIITHVEQMISAPRSVGEGDDEIRDDALRLMFVCCHPSIAPDAQVVLALKVLCGFSTAEIARAFLSSEAAIEKQLTRTKQRIELVNLPFEIPEGENLAPRLDGVLTALYLLFNEGYKASAGERLLREDLCAEAIRLTSLLVVHSDRRHAPRACVARADAVEQRAISDARGRRRRFVAARRTGSFAVGSDADRARAGPPRRSCSRRGDERISPGSRHRGVSLHRSRGSIDGLGSHSSPLR